MKFSVNVCRSRHPARFRNLSDQSLNKEAVNDLRAGLLGKI